MPTKQEKFAKMVAKRNAELEARAAHMIDTIIDARDLKHPEAEAAARDLLTATFKDEGLTRLEEVYLAVRLLQKYGL